MDAIAIETLRQEVREGRIGVERLVDLIASQQRMLQATQEQLQAAKQRIDELEKKHGVPPTPKLDQAFSMRAEEQRQQARGKKRKSKHKGRHGRVRSKGKIALAERSEPVFPKDVPAAACHLSHVRPVWRLENGRAVLIAYQIYRGPNSQYGQIPGVLGRSEFGLEIVTEIAYLVYITGVSIDKACMLLQFFQNLELKKAQANVLLYRLARHWEREFEILCTLLAHSMVVHADETSWSLNSLWAFVSEQARVLLFGVHKDADTLKLILDPASFAGILFSDDASVYENFTAAQKCWAHLLRKAIKLTLQDPTHADYRTFMDRLLNIYRSARRLQCDQRFCDAGRADKVALLDDEILSLCTEMSVEDRSADQGLDHDFDLLLAEVLRLMMKQELFTFVTAPPVQQPNGAMKAVDGTNNEAERTLRPAAQARDTGRTNKTGNGTRRQTIVTSVLESLRLYLPTYTLASVVKELRRWQAAGRSCFERLLHKLKLTPPQSTTSILDRIFPRPTPCPAPSG
jgi:transposase